MKLVMPDLKAKIAPVLDDAKKESLPFLHALRYCAVWLCWVAMVPFVVLGAWLGEASKKIKPELPAKPEL